MWVIPNHYKYCQEGWTIIHLEGSPYKRGLAYGYLIVNEINDIHNTLIATTPIFFGKNWSYFVEKTKAIYGKYLIGELREELQGISDGLNQMGKNWDIWDVYAWNLSNKYSRILVANYQNE